MENIPSISKKSTEFDKQPENKVEKDDYRRPFRLKDTPDSVLAIANVSAADSLDDVLADGIPDTWQQHSDSYRTDQSHLTSIRALAVYLMGQRYVYDVDDDGNEMKRPRKFFISPDRSYFAKEKWTQPELFNRWASLKHVSFNFKSKSVKNRAKSLLSEFYMSELVENALENDMLTQRLKRIGFKGVGLIRPLAGMINKASGIRTVVYKLVEGENLSSHNSYGKSRAKKVIGAIETVLTDAGINPADLHDDQLIVSDDKKLHLLDIDHFAPAEKS